MLNFKESCRVSLLNVFGTQWDALDDIDKRNVLNDFATAIELGELESANEYRDCLAVNLNNALEELQYDLASYAKCIRSNYE